MVGVALHAAGAHAEAVAGPLVVVRIERHDEVFGVAELVPARHGPRDLADPRAPQPGRHVERSVVVGEGHLGLVGRDAALDGLLLREVGKPERGGPDRVVQPAVDVRRLAGDFDRPGHLPEARVSRLGGQGSRGKQRGQQRDWSGMAGWSGHRGSFRA